jgi:hypothetical protein
MELNSIHPESQAHLTHELVKCGICRNAIRREAMIYREGLSFGVVCETCYKSNSSEDLELMANLFMAFGGYFGMLKEQEFSLHDTIKDYLSKNKGNTIENQNISLMHKALLHGITPNQYKQSFKILSD